MSEEEKKHQMLLAILDAIWSSVRTLEEKVDCIQHSVCKNDDEKTIKAIKAYLISSFRNHKDIYGKLPWGKEDE